MALLATQRSAMTSRAHDPSAPKHTLANSIELFRQPAILLCFAYFCAVTVAVIGIQTFIGTSLHAAYDVALAVATSALTVYLLCAAAGILVRRISGVAHATARSRGGDRPRHRGRAHAAARARARRRTLVDPAACRHGLRRSAPPVRRAT